MSGVANMQEAATAEADAVCDPRLRGLVDYWAARRGPDRPAPARHELDPADMQPLLPWIMLLDVLDDDYRYRLVGTGLDGLFGRALTGTTLRQSWPAHMGGHWRHWMDRASREALPVATGAILNTRRGRLRLDGVILPLSNHPGRIDMLLCGVMGSSMRRPPSPLLRPTDEVVEDELLGFQAMPLTL
ncbi:PAS domain-containing protein [Niveispirillum sp. KHB5.9]|uniref:PAS domain-containing protein n=1 Tax=Niveispirillum sp. KHB5.9 TaxID=3400269 RepID=UPI003A8B5627